MPTRDRFGPFGVPRLEFAKRLKGLRDIVSRDQFEVIRSMLVAPDQTASIDRIIQGFDQEDEFAVTTRLMDTASLLIPLEQTPILQSDYTVPDFLATFAVKRDVETASQTDLDAFTCLIEVKSTKKPSFTHSGGAVNKLRATADMLQIPLVFAIRFIGFQDYAVWALVEDTKKEGPIKAGVDHVLLGIRETIWSDKIYVLNGSPILEYQYDRNYAHSAVRSHGEDIGGLTRLSINYNDWSFEQEGEEASRVGFLLQSFNLRQCGSAQSGSITKKYMRPHGHPSFATTVDMVYHLNRATYDDLGKSTYKPPQIIATSGNREDVLITRLDIEAAVRSSIDHGVISDFNYQDFISKVLPKTGSAAGQADDEDAEAGGVDGK